MTHGPGAEYIKGNRTRQDSKGIGRDPNMFKTDFRYFLHILRRKRPTPTQARLAKEESEENEHNNQPLMTPQGADDDKVLK